MKKIIIFLFVAAVAVYMSSCRDDDPSSTSIFQDDNEPKDEFDTWILQNFTDPYNIDAKYRMEDIETQPNLQLIPATAANSYKLLRVIKHAWLEAYDEVAGIEFTRQYAPRVLHMIGSAGFSSTGTEILGNAEGGLKITFFRVNSFQIIPSYLNYYYLNTMHHEFAHILHQTKLYSPDFQLITRDEYVGDNWYLVLDSVALSKGYISNYAMKSPDEDFVETLSNYVTSTPEEWAADLESATSPGDSIINLKLSYVRNYLNQSWDIQIDTLRSVVLRRINEIQDLDLDINNIRNN